MAGAKEFEGVAEYAKRRGCTIPYVYQLIWSGRVKAEKVDGVWRIPLAGASPLPARARTRELEHAATHAG